MKYDDPCDDHYTFDWDCQKCKNIRQRALYNDNKDDKKYCKYCRRDINKCSYSKHRKTKIHRYYKKLAKNKD